MAIQKCISQLKENHFNHFAGMCKVLMTSVNNFSLHKSAYFFRPAQSISFQDEETKRFLRPFLVQIANASFRTGISPSFLRYIPVRTTTQMFPAYPRSSKHCPTSNFLCQSKVVEKHTSGS